MNTFRRVLVAVCLLPFAAAACAGQQHPVSLSERVECQLGLLSDVVHQVPDADLYAALMGDPGRLVPYLLKAAMSPDEAVDLVNAWKACEPSPPEAK